MDDQRLQAELRALRAELKQLGTQHQRLARVFLTYISQAHLDRPERIAKAQELAELGITIVGGEPADPGQFDECAAIGRTDIAGLYASGVLAVSPRLVLTAAHCGPPVSTLPTTVALRIQDTSKLAGGEVLPGDFTGYPGYVEGGPHDIGVMVLPQGAQTPFVNLATTAEMQAATEVILVGFGDDDAAATSGGGIKRYVSVPIQFLKGGPSDTPGNPMAKLGFDKDLEFVAGLDGAGVCIGDSGGPAYIEVGGVRKVAGISSRIPGTVCSGLSILTRIDVHAEWILSQVPRA
jgi:endonuclease G